MSYVDGFLVPVPKKNVKIYTAMSAANRVRPRHTSSSTRARIFHRPPEWSRRLHRFRHRQAVSPVGFDFGQAAHVAAHKLAFLGIKMVGLGRERLGFFIPIGARPQFDAAFKSAFHHKMQGSLANLQFEIGRQPHSPFVVHGALIFTDVLNHESEL